MMVAEQNSAGCWLFLLRGRTCSAYVVLWRDSTERLSTAAKRNWCLTDHGLLLFGKTTGVRQLSAPVAPSSIPRAP